MKISKFLALGAAASLTLGLSACGGSDSDSKASDTQNGQQEVNTDSLIAAIKADPEIEKLVPEDVKNRGILRNGTSADYPPAEFKKEDGQTTTGYDVDTVKAIAKVMGLKEGTTEHTDFDGLIPKIGAKYDVGAASLTITAERLAQMNMISVAKVGFQYGVAKGNPNKFNPKDVCGKTIGVQTGTAQQEELEKMSEQCKKDGKKEIAIKPHTLQSEVTQKVVGGQYDATLADSPVIGYAVTMSDGAIEKIGEVFMTAQHGIAVAKKDEQLAKAVEAALNKLISDGTLKKIYEAYGAGDSLVEKSVLNPQP